MTPPTGHRTLTSAVRGRTASDPGATLQGKVCHRQYGDLHGCPVIELKALLLPGTHHAAPICSSSCEQPCQEPQPIEGRSMPHPGIHHGDGSRLAGI
eukprot:1046422-Amphidinium_carterae.2